MLCWIFKKGKISICSIKLDSFKCSNFKELPCWTGNCWQSKTKWSLTCQLSKTRQLCSNGKRTKLGSEALISNTSSYASFMTSATLKHLWTSMSSSENEVFRLCDLLGPFQCWHFIILKCYEIIRLLSKSSFAKESHLWISRWLVTFSEQYNCSQERITNYNSFFSPLSKARWLSLQVMHCS